MTQIQLQMDQAFHWWPVVEPEAGKDRDMRGWAMMFEVDQSLIDRYQAARREYEAVQQQLEQLYRIGNGLDPWPGVEIPNHTWL